MEKNETHFSCYIWCFFFKITLSIIVFNVSCALILTETLEQFGRNVQNHECSCCGIHAKVLIKLAQKTRFEFLKIAIEKDTHHLQSLFAQ